MAKFITILFTILFSLLVKSGTAERGSPLDEWRKSFSAFPNTAFWPSFHVRDFNIPSFDEEPVISNRKGINREPLAGGSDSDEIGDVSGAFDFDTDAIFEPIFNNQHHWMSIFGSRFPGVISKPWWQGPNICTEVEETEEDETDDKQDAENMEFFRGEGGSMTTSLHFGPQRNYLQSCVEHTNKRICTKVLRQNGKKKVTKTIKQCCLGYMRLLQENGVSSSSCQKVELKSLVETVEELGAKEFMRSAKKSGLDEKLNSNITLFLPTDEAFTVFSEQMFENNLVVLPLNRRRRTPIDSSGITTKELVLYHMVDGWEDLSTSRNEDQLITNYDNTTIRINLFRTRNPKYSYLHTANCVPIVKMNQFTMNGIVHAIDRVLTPVTKTIMDVIEEREDMTFLRMSLKNTKVDEILRQKDQAFTLLAFTDSVYKKLDIQMRRTIKEGRSCAANILKNHILNMTLCTSAVDPVFKVINFMNHNLVFESKDPKPANDTRDTEVNDLVGAKEIVINEIAKITTGDIMATNGVIHIIDMILPTETAAPITSLMTSKNISIFRKLIDRAGLSDQIDDMENVTIFVPTDHTLEGSVWANMLKESSDLKDNQELKNYLESHIVTPKTKSCDLGEDVLTTKTGNDLRVNRYPRSIFGSITLNHGPITINCATVEGRDYESCGSVLHVINKDYSIPSKNLLQQLESEEKYSKFLDLIKQANLTHILEDSNDTYTVLVPLNSIFDEAKDWLKEMTGNEDKLKHLAETHIVKGDVCCGAFVRDSHLFEARVSTLDESRLPITQNTRRRQIGNAGVTKCDILATNGLIHEINDFISVPERRLHFSWFK